MYQLQRRNLRKVVAGPAVSVDDFLPRSETYHTKTPAPPTTTIPSQLESKFSRKEKNNTRRSQERAKYKWNSQDQRFKDKNGQNFTDVKILVPVYVFRGLECPFRILRWGLTGSNCFTLNERERDETETEL